VAPLNPILKVVVGFFAVIGAAYFVFAVYFSAVGRGCIYSEPAQALSANGEYFAVHIQTACPDPEKSHSRVEMGKRGVKTRSVLLEIRGITRVGLMWETDHDLVVSYPRSAVVTQYGTDTGMPRVTFRPTDIHGDSVRRILLAARRIVPRCGAGY